MELLDPSNFKSYRHAAAGHKGTMSDESEEFFIKPSTQKEIDFYNEVKAQDSPLENLMPRFYGSLGLVGSNNEALIASALSEAASSTQTGIIGASNHDSNTNNGTVAAPVEQNFDIQARLNNIVNGNANPDVHGRAIKSSQYLVLENLTGGFVQPNVMDIKLGRRLWDDDAVEEKRQRLDKVANSTTSSEKNFRIAGIRMYVGEDHTESYIKDPFPWRTITGVNGLHSIDDTLSKAFAEAAANYGYLYDNRFPKPAHAQNDASEEINLITFAPAPDNVLVHTKHYGRAVNSWDIFFVIKRFIQVKSANITQNQAIMTLHYFLEECKAIKLALETSETRMYSPSILLVYEGDGIVFDEKLKVNDQLADEPVEYDSDGDEIEQVPEKLFELKLIDFAHATFTPGHGSDTNIIKGVDNLIQILEAVLTNVTQHDDEHMIKNRS